MEGFSRCLSRSQRWDKATIILSECPIGLTHWSHCAMDAVPPVSALCQTWPLPLHTLPIVLHPGKVVSYHSMDHSLHQSALLSLLFVPFQATSRRIRRILQRAVVKQIRNMKSQILCISYKQYNCWWSQSTNMERQSGSDWLRKFKVCCHMFLLLAWALGQQIDCKQPCMAEPRESVSTTVVQNLLNMAQILVTFIHRHRTARCHLFWQDFFGKSRVALNCQHMSPWRSLTFKWKLLALVILLTKPASERACSNLFFFWGKEFLLVTNHCLEVWSCATERAGVGDRNFENHSDTENSDA